LRWTQRLKRADRDKHLAVHRFYPIKGGAKKEQQLIELGGADGVLSRTIGGGAPLCLIAGPCVLQDMETTMAIAGGLVEACAVAGVPLVFKASFDKANRTGATAARGPGMEAGLAMLAAVRAEFGVPVTTDVHLPAQAEIVAEYVDLLQVPAFLCRQTDLLLAVGSTGRPVNIKKGQFQAPWDMAGAVAKVRSTGNAAVMLTERGSTFGYNNLVVDMRGLPAMRSLGVPVCFDATHSVQLPGARGDSSGGQREMAPVLARAAVAVGVDAVFLEVHTHPEQSPSDAATILGLDTIPALLHTLVAVHRAVNPLESV
jgi:2-dehydro-3-deoxyphosphooctonate aldolase (KDO 8-P synthase)